MRISIIVPVLNEAECLLATLWSTGGTHTAEVIVVDGGSSDQSKEIARSFGAKLLCSAAGRAVQMNYGAACATGDTLLFLHADTCLPQGFHRRIRDALSQPGAVAGAFELGIEGKNPALRCVEWGANLRSRRLQLPYGDQAIFLRAAMFRQLGGFPAIPIMEDFELIRTLRRHGRIIIVPEAVTTWGRRWNAIGVWKTTLINQWIIACYALGVSPERLARWYHRGKR